MSEAATGDQGAGTTGTSEYQAAAALDQNATSADTPISTAQQGLPLTTPPAVHPAHAAIIQLAQSQAAPTADWATRAANAIQAAEPIIQASEQMSRASVKTQGWIALGELSIPVMASIIQMFFPHPAA